MMTNLSCLAIVDFAWASKAGELALAFAFVSTTCQKWTFTAKICVKCSVMGGKR